MVSQHDDWMQASVIAWCQLLMRSFHRWTGKELVRPEGTVQEQARRLFDAPFVVVSHGTEPDPIVSPRVADTLAARLPSAQLVRLDRTSHFVQVDRPGAVIDTIAEFLNA